MSAQRTSGSLVIEHDSPIGRPWMLYNARSDYAASAHWCERDELGRDVMTKGFAAESDDLAAIRSWAELQRESGASLTIYRMVAGLLDGDRRENFPVGGAA